MAYFRICLGVFIKKVLVLAAVLIRAEKIRLSVKLRGSFL